MHGLRCARSRLKRRHEGPVTIGRGVDRDSKAVGRDDGRRVDGRGCVHRCGGVDGDGGSLDVDGYGVDTVGRGIRRVSLLLRGNADWGNDGGAGERGSGEGRGSRRHGGCGLGCRGSGRKNGCNLGGGRSSMYSGSDGNRADRSLGGDGDGSGASRAFGHIRGAFDDGPDAGGGDGAQGPGVGGIGMVAVLARVDPVPALVVHVVAVVNLDPVVGRVPDVGARGARLPVGLGAEGVEVDLEAQGQFHGKVKERLGRDGHEGQGCGGKLHGKKSKKERLKSVCCKSERLELKTRKRDRE